MNSNYKFTYVTTFAGCGGSSTGYELAGGKGLLAVEFNENAVKNYHVNHPKTPIYYGDIHNLTEEKIRKLIPNFQQGKTVDILDGSPPCQGFSGCGKGDPNDVRNTLYLQYIRVLNILKPRVSVIENVKGLTFKKNKHILNDMFQKLMSSGYTPRLKIMNSKYYECATERERVIIISTRNDLNIVPSFPEHTDKIISIREALMGVKPEGIKIPPTSYMKYFPLCEEGNSLSSVHPKGSFFNQIYVDVNKPAPTITKSNSLAVRYKDTFRYIAPNELSILQSFPRDYKWIGSWNDKVNRIGNSVPPMMMKHIAEHIYKTILKQ